MQRLFASGFRHGGIGRGGPCGKLEMVQVDVVAVAQPNLPKEWQVERVRSWPRNAIAGGRFGGRRRVGGSICRLCLGRSSPSILQEGSGG